MKAHYDKILSKKNASYIKDIIDNLEDGNYVFVLGPNGMGKTTILKTAMKVLENKGKYRCLFFDMSEDTKKGAHFFYNHILEKISGKQNLISHDKDLSNEFIRQLDFLLTGSDLTTILFFDSFRVENRDFYDHFSKDCRKIFHEGRSARDSGLSCLLMAFGGSMVSSGQMDTFPLWNITEQIEILPSPEAEFKENIIFPYLNERLIDRFSDLVFGSRLPIDMIYEATLGHVFLARAMVRFLTAMPFENKTIEKSNIVDEFVEYILRLLDIPGESPDHYEKKLKNHFLGIINYLKNSSQVLRTVLRLMDGGNIRANRIPVIDNITISGAISKDENGFYYFANPIYEVFFDKLLKSHLIGDFCLAHSQEEEFWEIAKEKYYALTKRNLDSRGFGRISDLNQPIKKLREKLNTTSTTAQMISEFIDIIFIFFGIKRWGIYKIKNDKNEPVIYDPDLFFKHTFPKGRWLEPEELTHHTEVIQKAVKRKIPMVDWTGRILIVPVLIREDFGRIFIARPDTTDTRIHQGIIDFVYDSLTTYFYLRSKEDAQNALICFKDSIKFSESAQKKEISDLRQIMHHLWEATRPVLKDMGLYEYYFYEIYPGDKIILTHSSEKTLSDNATNVPSRILWAASVVQSTGYLFYRPNIHYLGKKLDNGVIIMLEFFLSPKLYEKISKKLDSVILLIHFAINMILINGAKARDAESHLALLKRTLLSSGDYLYVVDREKRILFINDKLRSLLNKNGSMSSLMDKPCYNMHENEETCLICPCDKVFSKKEPIRVVRKIEAGGNTHVMDCAYSPIWDESKDQVIAVAIFMYDLGDRQRLWEALEHMEKIDNIHEMDSYILETLKKFGFKRVFGYRYDSSEKGHFISVDYMGPVRSEIRGEAFRKGEKEFVKSDTDLFDGRLIVWCRRKTPNVDFKETLEERLKGSTFRFKESYSMPEYDPEISRPDFWVSLPIMGRNEIVNLYTMDNWGDESKDREIITLDRLHLLETFATAAGQIRENARQRYVFGKFKQMISCLTRQETDKVDEIFQTIWPVLEKIVPGISGGAIISIDKNKIKTESMINMKAEPITYENMKNVTDNDIINEKNIVTIWNYDKNAPETAFGPSKDLALSVSWLCNYPNGETLLMILVRKLAKMPFTSDEKNIIRDTSSIIGLTINYLFIRDLVRKKIKDEATLEAKKDLTMRAVHNIRNPIEGIHTFLHVIKKRYPRLDPGIRDILDKMETQIIRVEELVNDFFRYLKPMKMRVKRFDINTLIKNVAKRFKDGNKKANIDFLFQKSSATLDGDLEGLKWVVEEMLNNAVQNGANNIKISTSVSGGNLTIKFENDGSPIDEMIKQNIFTPFVTNSPKGTGLGLANIKKIVEEHKGEISFIDDFTKGACFMIKLPVTYQISL